MIVRPVGSVPNENSPGVWRMSSKYEGGCSGCEDRTARRNLPRRRPRLRPLVRVGLAGERTALRVDDAEHLARGSLHQPPPLEELDALGAELLEPRDLGLEVIGFDVEVDAAVVLDLLQEHDRLVVGGVELAIVRIAGVGWLDLAA